MYSGKIAVPPGGGGLRLGNVLYTNYRICANHVGASCLKELPFFIITFNGFSTANHWKKLFDFLLLIYSLFRYE
jgi:hypothetical protein